MATSSLRVTGPLEHRWTRGPSVEARYSVLLTLLVCSVAIATGYAVSQGGRPALAASAVAVVLTGGLLLANIRVRAREVALWGLIVVFALTYVGALFAPTDLDEQSLGTRAVRDLALLPLFVIAALYGRGRKVERIADGIGVLLILSVALSAAILIDGLVRETTPSQLAAPLRYFVLYPLALVAIVRLDLTDREITRSLGVAAGVAAIVSLVAVADSLNLIGSTAFDTQTGEIGGVPVSRAISTLGNPNNLGLFLTFAAFFLVTRAAAVRARNVLLVLVLIGIAASFSRTAVAGLALGTLAILVVRRGPGRARLAISAAVALPLIGGLALTNRFDATSATFGTRTTTIPESFQELNSDMFTLLFGHGYGSELSSAGGSLSPDNIALTVGLEGGLIAVGLFAGLVVSAALLLRHAVRQRPGAVTYAATATTAAFAVYSISTNSFRLFPGALMFWVVIGLAVSWSENERSSANRL